LTDRHRLGYVRRGVRGRVMMSKGILIAVGALAVLASTACEEGDGTMDEMVAEDEVVDDLAEIPPKPDSDLVREYISAEQIVPPGTEVQTCYFLEPEEADMYARALTSFQGEYGHHFVLFSAAVPEAPGTVRDCTRIEDMINLIPAISSVNFGLEEFPPGMAIRIATGTQLVLQQHIVNTSEHPIRVRDGMHLELLKKEDVEILAGFYGISDVGFVLPPNEGVEQEVEFHCEVPRDMNLLLMGPHMHEWGVRFSAAAGPADALEEIIRIDPWFAEYRDEPPVTEWGVDAPLRLQQGDLIQTTCVFNNTAGEDLEFPGEMCATYGYYYPAPEGSEAWTCAGTRE
jgi:hypothetical protein